MIAEDIVRQLVESDADDFDPEDIASNPVGDEFRRGTHYVLERAEDLYRRLESANVLSVLRQERDYDQESISGAVLLLALQRLNSLGVERAHKRIKKLSQYII